MQAKELAARLAKENISHIFSSPFLRAIETAREVARVLNLKIKVEAGLSEWLKFEWFFPEPVLMPMENKIKLFPEIDPLYKSFVTPVYPETVEEMENRVKQAVDCIVHNFTGNMLFVGHGASVYASASALVGKEHKISTALCSLTKIVRNNNDWVLELNGDVSHLSNSETTIKWN